MDREPTADSTRTLEAETIVEAPIADVFDLLVDVPRYDEFSEYLQSVTADGDGGPGTVYRLRFEWWRLSYTAVSRVESIDRPRRIDWQVIKDVDANGAWRLSPVGAGDGGATGERTGDEDGSGGRSGTDGGNGTRDEHSGQPGDGSGKGPESGATRVILAVEYDPGSVTAGIIDLPRFVSLDHVIEKATPLVEREARTVLERLVAELEGERRAIELDVRHG